MGDHEGRRGMKAGTWEGRRRESPPPKPKKEVGSGGRGAESLGERPKGAGKETGKGGMERLVK